MIRLPSSVLALASLLAAQGQALLRDAGTQLLSHGQIEPALNALDGAWLLGGRAPDPEYGKLLVDAAANVNLAKSMRNLAQAKFLPVEGLNTYDILNYPSLVLTVNTVKAIEARLATTSPAKAS